jgi:exodeoxyribonuclease V alpha subunit
VPSCAEHFVDVIKDDGIYYNKDNMEVSLRATYETEKYIADTILSNIHNEDNVWDFDVQKYRAVGEFELSDEQMQILNVVCKNNIAILNGFAGAGKTASTQGIINMLKDNNKSFRLFSPTGRAAKVLHENTNELASTIHRGLGYVPPNQWTYNEQQKLHADIIIVDEFSMVDIWLFKKLLDAIDFKYTKLLMIGDNAQLPSVSCGNLLHDFMEANIIPTITLNKIFRYSSGGLMRVATDTRCCKEYLTKDMKAKATTFGDNQDYMFIDLASELIPKNVVALYKKLLDNGSNIEDIQVLTAINKGGCGSVELNNMIQRVANPNYGSEVNMKVGDTTYYQGDLITQTINNYKAELDTKHLNDEERTEYEFSDEPPTAFVANGEVGIIEEIYNTYVIANFNGIRVKYYRNDMNMVKLGYCISIHRSQGGGFKKVILCTPQSHTFMLNSNLLYVGLTRMKQKLYHLGSLQTINQAVKKKANMTRRTFMQNLLKTS